MLRLCLRRISFLLGSSLLPAFVLALELKLGFRKSHFFLKMFPSYPDLFSVSAGIKTCSSNCSNVSIVL